MYSATRYWADGQVSEWCGELINTDHTTMLDLCRRFALRVDDLIAAQPPRATPTFFVGGGYYETADRDFEAVYRALEQDFEAAGEETTYQTSTPGGVALDNLSAHDWIRTRVPGGHGSPLGVLLDLAFTQEFGADTTDQSALNIVYALTDLTDDGAFDLFGVSDERYHIRGGNQLLPLAIARTLPEGTIVRGWRLTAIEQSAAGTVTLTFHTARGEQTVSADLAILALPFAVLRTLDCSRARFDPLKQRAIQELGRGRNGKLMVQFADRYWNRPGPWGVSNGTTYSDTGYQAGWEVSRAQSGQSGILVGFSGGSCTLDLARYQSSPHTTVSDPGTAWLASRLLAQLDPVFPGLAACGNGRALLSLPHLDPNLQLSYSFPRVGQHHTLLGSVGLPQGSIHFTGEHCSTKDQGYMEGAASEGIRVANEVLARLQPGPTARPLSRRALHPPLASGG